MAPGDTDLNENNRMFVQGRTSEVEEEGAVGSGTPTHHMRTPTFYPHPFHTTNIIKTNFYFFNKQPR